MNGQDNSTENPGAAPSNMPPNNDAINLAESGSGSAKKQKKHESMPLHKRLPDMPEDQADVWAAYQEMLTFCNYPENEIKVIDSAFRLAYEKHNGIFRKSGEPYILHPIAVAQIVAEEIVLDSVSIVCALLHDVVEDTDTTLADIGKLFDPIVAKIVDGLTKIKSVTKKNPVSQKADNLRRVVLTLGEDIRVILIKLADRLHNMRTLESMHEHRQVEISNETMYIYIPTAHRLGLYRIKSELEDLCMKYTSPHEYKEIASKLAATKREREKYISEFIEPLKERLTTDGIKFRIFGRPKHIYSIWNKIKKKNVAFEEIFDLFAIRIVLDASKEEEREICWRVYSIITSMFVTSPDRLRDWVTIPKSNGYESLHTTVFNNDKKWVEIQIRSERMDAIAERGVAAHWKYKGGRTIGHFDDWLTKVREVFQNSETNALEFLNNYRRTLYTDEVYVFTPAGEIRILPSESTVLDFAFDIHTDLGCSCIGGEIDGKLYRINYQLKNGQQVKIITSKKQKPGKEWLEWVTTSKARTKIKSVLNGLLRSEADAGREIFERKIANWKLNFTPNHIQELATYFKYPDQQYFFAAIARNEFNITDIKKIKISGEKLLFPDKGESKNTKIGTDVTEIKGKNTDEVIMEIYDNFINDLDYSIASCCQPMPGDDVFGFITINHGIRIHRTTCPNADQLHERYPYRIVSIKWHGKTKDVSSLVTLIISGIDDIGLVNRITSVISNEQRINMRSISFSAQDGIFEGKIEAYFKDKDEMTSLVKRLMDIEGIHSAKRL